jgi:Sulfotransferase family
LSHRPTGCVDGIIDGELRGWVANPDYPDRLEHVVCRNSRGAELIFCPFVYREDVVNDLGVIGVFGFAIPLDLLSPLAPCCVVTDQYGNPLQNGENVSVSGGQLPNIVQEPLNIYLHISKTAGTSLRNTLMRTVRPGEQLLIYPGTAGIFEARFHQIPLSQRNRLRWVFGHCKFGLDRHVTKPVRYVSFVREPMDRLRSNFAHHVAADTLFAIDGVALRLTTVFNEGLVEDCDNLMTRVFAGAGRELVPLGHVGEDEVEIALANVRRRFSFVGRQDRADADTMTLQSHLGLPLEPLSVDNVTQPSNSIAENVSALDWPRIGERNRADLLLYNRLEQEGLLSRVLQ